MKAHVSMRLAPADIARVDALIPEFSTPWHDAGRSEVLRALVLEALDAREGRAAR